MNVDEAMKIAKARPITAGKWEMAEVADILAEEVERLRAEVDFHSEACKGLIAELAEKKAENDKLRAVVGNKDAAIEVLANAIDKLQAELAAT